MRDFKGDCEHDYCPDEYCFDIAHLVPNKDFYGKELVHLPLTDDEVAVLRYVLSKHESHGDEQTTEIDVILSQLRIYV